MLGFFAVGAQFARLALRGKIMNAYELLARFILETEKEFLGAKKEENFWREDGLRRLYNYLKDLKTLF